MKTEEPQSSTAGAAIKALALNPYHGGSHAAFLNGWASRSRHSWTIRGLRAHKWKWRMRHAAYTMAAEVAADDQPTDWDCIFVTDMLNVAELRGFLPPSLRDLPILLYFHENQLTHPTHPKARQDLHFAMTNLLSAAAADAIWFNSAYHKHAFLDGMRQFLAKMPDHAPLELIDELTARAQVFFPGIPEIAARCGVRKPGPLRILWSARWEFDKNPQCFFDALDLLAERGVAFRLSVLGRSNKRWMSVFDEAKIRFGDRIDAWGFVKSRAGYEDALREADVVVSTAHHEFFGIAVAEAVSAGALPVTPNDLAYPEVLADLACQDPDEPWFHDNSALGVADRLQQLAIRLDQTQTVWPAALSPASGHSAVASFSWPQTVQRMDDALSQISTDSSTSC